MNRVTSQLRLIAVATPEDPRFAQAMAIYDASFPLEERRPHATVATMVREGRARMVLGLGAQEQVLAMALVVPLADNGYTLLDYLAVSAEGRGQGTGSDFLRRLAELLGQTGCNRLLIEVEDPTCGDDRELRRRRVAFYERLGARLVPGLLHRLPALQGEGVLDLRLMTMALRAGVAPLDRAALRRALRAIFCDLLGRTPGDALLGQAMAQLVQAARREAGSEEAAVAYGRGSGQRQPEAAGGCLGGRRRTRRGRYHRQHGPGPRQGAPAPGAHPGAKARRARCRPAGSERDGGGPRP